MYRIHPTLVPHSENHNTHRIRYPGGLLGAPNRRLTLYVCCDNLSRDITTDGAGFARNPAPGEDRRRGVKESDRPRISRKFQLKILRMLLEDLNSTF